MSDSKTASFSPTPGVTAAPAIGARTGRAARASAPGVTARQSSITAGSPAVANAANNVPPVTNRAPEVSPAIAPGPPPAAEDTEEDRNGRKPKPGDSVKAVLASGAFVDAEVITVHSDTAVDLSFDDRGSDVRITKSPYDPTGKRPDSWHFEGDAQQ